MHSNDLEIDNLPNRLTLFRVVLVPFVVFCLYVEKMQWLPAWQGTLGWIAGWTFVAASITDFFDGYIARKRGIVTVFGSFLDPIADKFLVVASLVMLEALGRISSLVVIVLILREMYMTSLRLLANTENLSVPVSELGKWKTATQMVGIPLLMANGTPWGIPIYTLGLICIYGATILSIYSATMYSLGLIKKLKIKRQERKHEQRS